jgi:YidC/Oxa1 family membrane protein insertase
VENQRNMILAFVLSALVLIGWSTLSERFFPPPKPIAPVAASAGAPTGTVAAGPAAPVATSSKILRDVAAVRGQSPRIAIDTAKLSGSINLRGAQIDDLVLTAYKETIKKESPAVRLFSPSGAKGSYFAGFGWAGDGVTVPGPQTVWQPDSAALTVEKPVTLRWANSAGQTFAIKISVDADYMFTVEQSVSNAGNGAVAARPYAFLSRFGPSKDHDTWTAHVGPLGAFNGAVHFDVNWSTLDEAGAAGKRFPTTGGWIGFGDQYWLAALVPDQKIAIDAGFRAADGSYQAEFAQPETLVQPGKSVTTTTRLFAGGKEVALLDKYQSQLGIPLFSYAIDWGWFWFIAKPFFYLLHWLFELVGNFGVAIILLTFIVRGSMFPLAQRQFASMAAMRVVQPKMKAIQDRYKDDKPKLQQELMALYKTEKINPMAGCLPILPQIPIFYALYKVLLLTIEMRHQPFALWIKDLSAPDPAHILNLFGLLPFEVPGFLGIGGLAILLGITMYLQFKLNPAPMDPVQQQMFAIMPWVMMFMMAPFAAGLLIYWTTSNILTIAQQKLLYSRHPALKEPVKA